MTQEQFFIRYKYDRAKDRIGGGGFGNVYKVFDTIENETVALKIAEVRQGQENLSLQKEVELASSLERHVNIARYTVCYRFDLPNGHYDFGLLQYYPLGNLSQLVKNKKLSIEEKEQIAKGVISGLQHLHKNNIIHRDLKSANILIAKGYGGEYVPKIADFGLSKQFAENDKSYFSNSFAGGSLHYVAPEQLEGKELRKNVDLWSLGVVLYELFAGETPFKANVDDGSETARAEIIRNIRNAIIPSTIGKVPSPWKDIIKNCLVPDPSKRIKTIEEVQQKLINNNRKENFEYDKTELEKIFDKGKLVQKIDNGELEKIIDGKHGKVSQNQIDNIPKNKNSWSIFGWFVVLTSFFIIGSVIWKASNKREIENPNGNIEMNEVKSQAEKDEMQRENENSITTMEKPYIKMISIPGRNFKLSETEVTIGQYLAFCKATNSHWPEWLENGNEYNIYVGSKKWYSDSGMSESNSNHPVTGISALDADAFCKWIGGRLPTEEEWEYAAKGGQSYKYAGGDNVDDIAWYVGNSGSKVHRVRNKTPNCFGLFDMSGNVWEWTSNKGDWYLRGGSYYSSASDCRISNRDSGSPFYRGATVGFRLAGIK